MKTIKILIPALIITFVICGLQYYNLLNWEKTISWNETTYKVSGYKLPDKELEIQKKSIYKWKKIIKRILIILLVIIMILFILILLKKIKLIR